MAEAYAAFEEIHQLSPILYKVEHNHHPDLTRNQMIRNQMLTGVKHCLSVQKSNDQFENIETLKNEVSQDINRYFDNLDKQN